MSKGNATAKAGVCYMLSGTGLAFSIHHITQAARRMHAARRNPVTTLLTPHCKAP
jgi:hypothetical protein